MEPDNDPLRLFLLKCRDNERLAIELIRVNAMQEGGASDQEITDYFQEGIGLPVKRINELIDAGLIKMKGGAD